MEGDDSAQGDTVEKDEEWNFVSNEEHPITGVPSFFLYMCQTSKSLYIFMTIGIKRDGSVEKNKPAVVLLSWLSIILPSTEFHILPIIFCAACKEIEML